MSTNTNSISSTKSASKRQKQREADARHRSQRQVKALRDHIDKMFDAIENGDRPKHFKGKITAANHDYKQAIDALIAGFDRSVGAGGAGPGSKFHKLVGEIDPRTPININMTLGDFKRSEARIDANELKP